MAKKTKTITAKQAKDAADKYLDDPKTIKNFIEFINNLIKFTMEHGKYSTYTTVPTQCKKIIDAIEAYFVSLGYTVRSNSSNLGVSTDFHLSWGDPNETHD